VTPGERTPVLHLLAGPNGAGKTTFYERILLPATRLPFVNADLIAGQLWPEDPGKHVYDAAKEAAFRRRSAIEARHSFIAETVFSHPSKVDLVRSAVAAGYRLILHGILIPEELAVHRVAVRVETGGHPVPEEKIRQRFRRLWHLIRQAIALVDEAELLDNSRAASPFRLIARYHRGELLGDADWPPWAPKELR